LGIANEDPTDRDRGNGGLIPQSRASRDLHHARCSPIPAQRLFLPDGLGVGETLSKLGLRLAFERPSLVSSVRSCRDARCSMTTSRTW
jgi:hypothetical protein